MEATAFRFPQYKTRHIKQHCRIVATASYFPTGVVTNQDIITANNLSVTDVAIRKTLGVERRHVAETGLADSDLLVEAAERCLQSANVRPEQLSKLLVTKFLGDRMLPMTASMVQRKLGSRLAFHALDVEGGINAFLHAFDLATRYISTTEGRDQYILILSGGLHNVPVSKTDPRLAFLFGDGSAAILLATAQEPHVLALYTYTNYEHFGASGSKHLKVEQRISESLYEKGDFSILYDLYQMGNWKDSIDFCLQAASVTRDNLLRASGLTMQDIDLVLVTENNGRIRDLTLGALGVPQDKSLSLIAEYGNTMTAMLPALLDKAYCEGLARHGATIMLISHGEGASGGGMIYRV
jgi:3-oxoacyl-[acyl-carrier-protein] synthase-3